MKSCAHPERAFVNQKHTRRGTLLPGWMDKKRQAKMLRAFELVEAYCRSSVRDRGPIVLFGAERHSGSPAAAKESLLTTCSSRAAACAASSASSSRARRHADKHSAGRVHLGIPMAGLAPRPVPPKELTLPAGRGRLNSAEDALLPQGSRRAAHATRIG